LQVHNKEKIIDLMKQFCLAANQRFGQYKLINISFSLRKQV